MSWDDSDDEWEKTDLKLPGENAKKEEDAWSDEEGHTAMTEDDKKKELLEAKRTAPQEKKEVVLTKLDLAIMEREEKERKEAEEAKAAKEARKKALKSKLDGDSSMGMSALEQELADGDGGFRGDDDDFEWDGGRGDGGLAPLPQADKPKAPSIDPETEADAAVVLERILRKFEGKKAHLSLLKGMLKKATDNMSTDDTKDLSSFVSVIFNDKLKADRDKDKKKPKAKAVKKINVSAGKAQDKDDDYDDGYGDYY